MATNRTRTRTRTITACPPVGRNVVPLLLALALTVACGGAQRAGAGKPLTARTAIDALPGDVIAVFGIDGTALRASPAWAKWVAPLERDPDVSVVFEQIHRDCGIDVLGDIDWLVAGVAPGEDDSAFRLIVHVRWDEAALIACAGKLVPGVTARSLGGLTEVSSSDGRFYVAWLDAHTLLVTAAGFDGDRAALLDVVERGRREPVHAELAALLPRVNVSTPLWGVVRDHEELRADSSYTGPIYRGAWFHLELPGDVHVRAQLHFDSADTARAGKAWIDQAVAPMLAELPPGPMRDMLTVRQDGADVNVTLDLPALVADAFLQGLGQGFAEEFMKEWNAQ
jgi:hypothetical protein